MSRSPIRFAVALAAVATLVAGSLQAQVQPKPVVPAEPPRAAKELVDTGVAQAAAARKNVLVKYSASWCGWCHKFEKFLEDTTGVGQIMRANFVVVGLTILETPQYKALENPGGVEIAKAMGGDPNSTGIPWFFMLDAAGKKLGDSNVMPDGSNIGMPDKPEEVTGFMDLLKRTAPKMTERERTMIKTHLDSLAGRKPVITP